MEISDLTAARIKTYLENNSSPLEQRDFLDSLIDHKTNTSRTDALTFENIKGITLEEIDTLFKDEESKQMAKNLRLATLFSKDDKLGLAMFNTVKGKPFNIGYEYLFNRYEDKHTFLGSNNDNLSDLLHKSLTTRLNENLKPNEVISQDRLDEILLEVNSFSFVDSLSRTSKDQYGRYKDDDKYSWLYNNHALEYAQLKQKYEEQDKEIEKLLNQYK